jgi:hypothetical protein
MTAAELLALARAYSDATGLALTTIGQRACPSSKDGSKGGNDKLFVRIAAGRGCNSVSLERASRWFTENWPQDAAWPQTVRRPAPAAAE